MAECIHLARTSAYFDGALPTAEEPAAVAHLAECAACQGLLGDAVALDAAIGGRPVRHRRRWWPAAAVAAAAAAVAITWTAWPHPAPPTHHDRVALVLPPARALEGRFTGPAFASYRPLGALRGDHAREDISLGVLAELEQRDDKANLAAAVAASGDLVRAKTLATEPADRAAIAMAAGDLDAALEGAQRAVAAAPSSPVAQWNLALAARAIGANRVARRAFQAVIAAGEPGWRDEAARDVAAIDRELAVEDGFAKLDARATAMVAGGPVLSAEDVAAYPARSRIAFADAVRLAPDRARLDALRPVAPDPAARAMIDRADPALAVKFGDRYRAVLAHTASDAEVARLLHDLAAAGPAAVDLRFGASVLSGQGIAELSKLTAVRADPWFDLYVARSQIQFPDGDLRAIAPLRALLSRCTTVAVAQRCGVIAQDLAELELSTGQLEDAEQDARLAIDHLGHAANLPLVTSARSLLAELHRLRGLTARARTEFGEVELSGSCEVARYARIGEAEVALAAGDLSGARAALPPVKSDCPIADVVGPSIAVDLARVSKDPDDRALAEAWLASTADDDLRVVGAARLGSGDAGAWLESHRDSKDPVIAGIATWGLTTAIDDAGVRNAWRDVITLARAPAAPCRVVVSADDASFVVAVETPAGLDGDRREITPGTLATERIVGDRLVRSLSTCTEIAVSARPPLHGRADLLPAELPWFFAGDAPARATQPGPSLAVGGVRTADPRLAPLATPAFEKQLVGDAATPQAVLAGLSHAGYAELDVHGIVTTSNPDTAYLALAPDLDGTFALRADRVRATKLPSAPFVVLAACRAATVAPTLRTRWSLPDAFLAAGASGVVAVDVAIPEAQARVTFDELHRRITAGEPPARALAALRAAAPPDSWIRRLMLFR